MPAAVALHGVTAVYTIATLYLCVLHTEVPNDTINFIPIFDTVTSNVAYDTLLFVLLQAATYTVLPNRTRHRQQGAAHKLLLYGIVLLASATLLCMIFILCGAYVTQLYQTVLLSSVCSVLLMPDTVALLQSVDITEVFDRLDAHSILKSVTEQQLNAYILSLSTVLISTYAGTFMLALDWEKQWQMYPLSCIVTSCIGYLVSLFVVPYYNANMHSKVATL